MNQGIEEKMTVEILRREFLLGLGAVAVLASEQSSAVVRGTLPAGAPDLSLPLNNLTNLIRMQSSLILLIKRLGITMELCIIRKVQNNRFQW
jgi:hypothetical protein